ncbi:hypothetical protein [Endozoicomonas sp. YOMI1]|uniref:hypothetical protein n=1 Tax=Endozoicomonas sp. YOMI1 TaxID=2828739 RepID=UPI00214801C6|nr:hypothetical protein [Endozoicomonas sp. YOMI1]
MSGIEWITVKKMAEETGYTEKAIRKKVSKGNWPQGLVWRHAPDNRLLFSKTGYNKWAESRPLS